MINIYRCKVCRCQSYLAVPYEITKPGSVVICESCSAVSTFPHFDQEENDAFYANEFNGDPGAKNTSKSDLERLEQIDFSHSIDELSMELIPLIEKFVDPKDKKWLEIRFRTGALLQILDNLGAKPHGIDFFENNKKSFSKINAKIKTELASPFDPLKPFENERFDVISGLSIHVLAHLPYPLEFLDKAYDLLEDDGLILFDEKDILKPTDKANTLPLEHPNPLGHFNHFTKQSIISLFSYSKFELIHCEYTSRKSDLEHMLIVARKRKYTTDFHASEVSRILTIINEIHGIETC